MKRPAAKKATSKEPHRLPASSFRDVARIVSADAAYTKGGCNLINMMANREQNRTLLVLYDLVNRCEKDIELGFPLICDELNRARDVLKSWDISEREAEVIRICLNGYGF